MWLTNGASGDQTELAQVNSKTRLITNDHKNNLVPTSKQLSKQCLFPDESARKMVKVDLSTNKIKGTVF